MVCKCTAELLLRTNSKINRKPIPLQTKLSLCTDINAAIQVSSKEVCLKINIYLGEKKK